MTAKSTIIDAHVTYSSIDPYLNCDPNPCLLASNATLNAHLTGRDSLISSMPQALAALAFGLHSEKARPCQASFYSSPHSFPATTCTPPHPLSQSFYFSTLIAARPVFDSWRNQTLRSSITHHLRHGTGVAKDAKRWLRGLTGSLSVCSMMSRSQAPEVSASSCRDRSNNYRASTTY